MSGIIALKLKKVKVMLTRKIHFLHMKLNSMDVQNINAMLGKLLWSVRKTSQAARAHGQTKPEPKHPQFVGQ